MHKVTIIKLFCQLWSIDQHLGNKFLPIIRYKSGIILFETCVADQKLIFNPNLF